MEWKQKQAGWWIAESGPRQYVISQHGLRWHARSFDLGTKTVEQKEKTLIVIGAYSRLSEAKEACERKAQA